MPDMDDPPDGNCTLVLMEGSSVIWRNQFPPAQLDALERHCDSLPLEPAQLTGGGGRGIRTTQVAWVHRNGQTEDLYLRMEVIVLRLNADLFHFDLTGLTTMQYAVYREVKVGYFDWHNDYGRYRGDPGHEPRKITMSLQLSDGAAYNGCDLEVREPPPRHRAARTQRLDGLSRQCPSPRHASHPRGAQIAGDLGGRPGIPLTRTAPTGKGGGAAIG